MTNKHKYLTDNTNLTEATEATEATETLVVAIVGATGAVGSLMVTELVALGLPNIEIRLFASKASAGRVVTIPVASDADDNGNTSTNPSGAITLTVEELTSSSFEGVGVALFAAGATVSRRYAPLAVEAGATVIDNSSAFRNSPTVPLVVPEVNPHGVMNHNTENPAENPAENPVGSATDADPRLRLASMPMPMPMPMPTIIANPNCVAIISAVAISPLHKAYGVEGIEMTTFQSASGAGRAAMAEVIDQASGFATVEDLGEMSSQRFAHPLLFNVIPQIGEFHDDGTTEEEHKIRQELQKILPPINDDTPEGKPIPCMATCVRVPTLTSHSMSITLQLKEPVDIRGVENVLRNAQGVVLCNNHHRGEYPMPIISSGTDDVYVGRLRRNPADNTKLHMFVAGDQLRKGAAVNALQILQLLLKST